jgi:multidrug resistance efflux pump
MNPKRIIPFLIIIVLLVAAGGWYYLNYVAADEEGILTASGTVEAVNVTVSPELSGRIATVYVSEGEVISEGDPLFELESDLLTAQRERALAALAAAQASYEVALQSRSSAQAAYDSALVQYQMAVTASRYEDLPQRRAAWQADNPDEFITPTWYFVKSEEMVAAESEIEAATEALEGELANFETVIADASNADLWEAEKHLADVQVAYLVAQDVLERAQVQNDEKLEDYAQSVFDTAEAELESAQLAYDQILSDQSAEDVLEARARVSVAQERYNTAIDYRDSLLTGEESLQVEAAIASLNQAETQLEQVDVQIAQTETAITQAEAELNLIDVQMEKLVVYAAVDALVMSRRVEPGEVVQPGASLMTLGQLEDLSITVYIPEDRYGQVSVGDEAIVTVDSFPDEIFTGVVNRIADEAEFTPRNVQTPEGRRTTVFGIKLTVNDPDEKLKPGMPADVEFGD